MRMQSTATRADRTSCKINMAALTAGRLYCLRPNFDLVAVTPTCVNPGDMEIKPVKDLSPIGYLFCKFAHGTYVHNNGES